MLLLIIVIIDWHRDVCFVAQVHGFWCHQVWSESSFPTTVSIPAEEWEHYWASLFFMSVGGWVGCLLARISPLPW